MFTNLDANDWRLKAAVMVSFAEAFLPKEKLQYDNEWGYSTRMVDVVTKVL